MKKDIEIIPQIMAWNRGVSFGVFQDKGMATKIKFVEQGEFAKDSPLFTTSIEATQNLMNELWRLGFRPTNQVGYEGQLEAVKHHLEDMRTLVFKPENPKLKG